MTSPLGLFVSVEGLSAEQLKKWFDRILKDHRREGSPFYIDNLALTPVASDINGVISLYETQLDWIKDYLPHFGNIFVGGFTPPPPTPDFDPFRDGIKNDDIRWAHIYGTREVANKFIKYYHSKNLTIPIHWYINYEADLNYFTDDDGIEITDKYTWYLMQVIEDLTQISLNNGLNQPQFLWSPYFGRRIRDLNGPTIDKLTARIRSILQNVPKLGWLHFQDGVGANAKKFSNGNITYSATAENAIEYFHRVLVPANDGGHLVSGIIDMEFFVMDGEDPNGLGIYTGDPAEQECRLCEYRRANIPVGISFEIRYWHSSLYGD